MPIQNFKNNGAQSQPKFKSVTCWSLNAAITTENEVYLWGLLCDRKAKKSLSIKVPELINDFSASFVATGPTMALLIEAQTAKPFVIGVNANGELGLGDKVQRKQLVPIPELIGKNLKQAAVGRSGYVIAVQEPLPNVKT